MNVRSITLCQPSVCDANSRHRLVPVSTCTFKQKSVQLEKLLYEEFRAMAIPFEQKSCKPTQNYLNYVAGFFHALTIKDCYDSVEHGINNILNVLDIHSQNQEYTAFVKEGLNFLKENKNSAKLYNRFKCCGDSVLDKGGFDTYFTIHKAFEQAVKPDTKYAYKPEILQEYIKKAREFMAAFKKEGVLLYPNGFIK